MLVLLVNRSSSGIKLRVLREKDDVAAQADLPAAGDGNDGGTFSGDGAGNGISDPVQSGVRLLATIALPVVWLADRP